MNLNIKPKEKLNKEKQKLHIKHHTYNNKGITLIALIITVVILLILAVVTINAVQGDGIIGYAKRAKNEWEEASEEEQNELIDLEVDVAGGPWKQEKDTITNIKTNEELKVGDKVNYSANGKTEYTDGWQILGVENGKILIISTKSIDSNGVTLNYTDGYKTGISTLNEKCSGFDTGEGAIVGSARSVNVNDINRLTGYNPMKTGNGNIYGKELVSEYGNRVTYKLENGKVVCVNSKGTQYEQKNGETKEYSKFKTPEGEELSENSTDSITETSTFYFYYPETLSSTKPTSPESDVKGISSNSSLYKMLFNKGDGKGYESEKLNEGDNVLACYWLADECVNAQVGCCYFEIREVLGDVVYGEPLFNSFGNEKGKSWTRGVRAVVSLKADVKLESSKSGEDGVNEWNINK